MLRSGRGIESHFTSERGRAEWKGWAYFRGVNRERGLGYTESASCFFSVHFGPLDGTRREEHCWSNGEAENALGPVRSFVREAELSTQHLRALLPWPLELSAKKVQRMHRNFPKCTCFSSKLFDNTSCLTKEDFQFLENLWIKGPYLSRKYNYWFLDV